MQPQQTLWGVFLMVGVCSHKKSSSRWQQHWQGAQAMKAHPNSRKHCAQANATYMDDPEMAKRLMETNPNSFRKLVATFLEANGRGYWDASPDQLDRLRELYMDVEDKIEGVE